MKRGGEGRKGLNKMLKAGTEGKRQEWRRRRKKAGEKIEERGAKERWRMKRSRRE